MNSTPSKPLSSGQSSRAVSTGDADQMDDSTPNSTNPVQNLNFQDIMQNFGRGDGPIEGMMESNPELRAMMEDPEQMRLMMDIASNPQLRLEYMRNMDRALSNIESLPGGFNALASMMNDASNSQNSGTPTAHTHEDVNPFIRLFPTTEATRINENPMPNPWQRRASGRSADTGLIPGMPAGLSQSQENMPAILDSILSEENLREVDRIMRDPEMRSRILRDMLGEQGSSQISQETLENLVSDFNSISGDLGGSLGLLNPLRSMSSNRDIDESEMNSKIQILKDMGFPNEEANRRALQTSGGDVNGAVEILLSAPSTF